MACRNNKLPANMVNALKQVHARLLQYRERFSKGWELVVTL
ncbi:hypothetical protein [Mucilaginibacter sp. NFX135]